MNNRNYYEMEQEAGQLDNLLDNAVSELRRTALEAKEKQRRIGEEYDEVGRRLSGIVNTIDRKCNEDEEYREGVVRNAVLATKDRLDSIKDKHFHRMEKRYIRSCGRGRYVSAGDTPQTVEAKINAAVHELNQKASALDNAFVSPGISGVIGSVVRSYRKKEYTEIIKLRDKVLSLCEALIRFNDISEAKNQSTHLYRMRMEREDASKQARLMAIPGEVKANAEGILNSFSQSLREFRGTRRLISSNRGTVNIGTCWIMDADKSSVIRMCHPEENGFVVADDHVGFGVGLESVRENLMFEIAANRSMSGYFSSLMVDIMASDENARTVFLDIKGLGGSYDRLKDLCGYKTLTILNSEDQVGKELLEIEQIIADANSRGSDRSLLKPIYLVIDDIFKNIPSKYYEQLARIINNGSRAGIYTICSMTGTDGTDRRSAEAFLYDIRQHIRRIPVKNYRISLTNDMKLYLTGSADIQAKIGTLKTRLENTALRSRILPVGRTLPEIDGWQRKSSAKGLEIEFGRDEDGNRAVLSISSEKPYGLIIGDMRVGKSSLIHTMIFKLLSEYAPSEVRIAIGDFKDGADFNVYALSKLKAVDTVVNDEDPDAMLSFLRYYVHEMHERKKQFEKVQGYTGRIIQKYEDFRTAVEEDSLRIEEMPRIVLFIDEFQTLFDGASSAEYMTELVRKGATFGMHVFLSSQRAISSNPHNGFTPSLKDYFTSRFVFRSPQSASRTVLSERCSDTGRENSGIQKSPQLEVGHVIYNPYMGQTEHDNALVQCYYASPDTVSKFIRLVQEMNGKGNSVLLKRGAVSLRQPEGSSILNLGMSVAYRRDSYGTGLDAIVDDVEVVVDPRKITNLLISGTDERVLHSIAVSVANWRKSIRNINSEFHIFGRGNLNGLLEPLGVNVHYHRSAEDQVTEIKRQSAEDPVECYNINIFIGPEGYSELAQTAGSIRESEGVAALKKVLDKCGEGKSLSIIYSRAFKNVRNAMPYAVERSPIRITSVGDSENLRYAMADAAPAVSGSFDIMSRDAIKAYYYNKDTEKKGKVILYLP